MRKKKLHSEKQKQKTSAIIDKVITCNLELEHDVIYTSLAGEKEEQIVNIITRHFPA